MRNLVLVLGLLAAACGEDQETVTYDEADLRALVPADAMVVGRMRSCRVAQDVLGRLAGAMKLQSEVPEVRTRFARTLSVEPRWIADDEPLAFAWAPEARAPGVLTFIVPAVDPDELQATRAQPGRAARGGFVALTARKQLRTGPCRLVKALPQGDFAVCVDIPRLAEAYRKEIDRGFAMFDEVWRDMPYVATLWPEYPAFAREVVESGDKLALGASVEDTRFLLDFTYEAREGTALAAPPSPSRLAELARFAPANAIVVVLVRLDLGLVLERQFAALREIVGEEDNVATRITDGFDAFRRALGGIDEWMVAYRIDADARGGLSFDIVVALHDTAPAEHTAACRALLEEHAKDARFEQAEAGRRVRASFPDKTGGAELFLDVAPQGDTLVLVASTDAKAAGRVLAAKAPPPAVAAELGRTRGELEFLFWSDARALTCALHALARATDKSFPFRPAAGPPVPVVAYGTAEGRTFHVGVSFDPVPIGNWMRSR